MKVLKEMQPLDPKQNQRPREAELERHNPFLEPLDPEIDTNESAQAPASHTTTTRILDGVAEHTDALHSSTLHVREIEKSGPAAILLGDKLLEYITNLVVPRPVSPTNTSGTRDRRRSQEVRHSVLVTRSLVHPASHRYTTLRKQPKIGITVGQGGSHRPAERPSEVSHTTFRTKRVGAVQRE